MRYTRLKFEICITRDEQLFEPIPEIDNWRKVGPFLKSYHIYENDQQLLLHSDYYGFSSGDSHMTQDGGK